MSEFLNAVRLAADGSLDGVSDAVILAMGVVGVLLLVASIFALFVSIYLAIRYTRYNRKQSSCGMRHPRSEWPAEDQGLQDRLHSAGQQLQPLFQEGAAEAAYMEEAERHIPCHGGAEIRSCRSGQGE